MLTALLLATTLSTATPAAPAAPDGWSQVRVGLSVQEVVRVVGRPLLRNAARGYERWVYDDGADVLFCGQTVVSWTCPKHAPVHGATTVANQEPAAKLPAAAD